MCKIGIMLGAAGENLSSAILFMNSNKSEKNIRKKVDKTREKCLSHGIIHNGLLRIQGYKSCP